MRRLLAIALAAAGVTSCGEAGSTTNTGAPPPANEARTSGVDRVPAEMIASCAGFTAETAAAVLGVPAGRLQDYSRDVGAMRECIYRDPNDRSAAIAFTLSARESVERAQASLGSERGAMGFASRAIDSAVGTASKTPAIEDVSNLGDGAFYSPLNGAIMLRVRNVIVQVMAPEDVPGKRRAAEQIVAGLRR